jgi:hypothetical protein
MENGNRLIKIFQNLFTFFRYMAVLLFHKLCVFYAGLYINENLKSTGLRAPIIRLLKHDNSKFSLAELWPYARQYYGNKVGAGFDKAWSHHYEANDHHWEHYVPNYIAGVTSQKEAKERALPMPDEALVEMAADWFAANLAYEGKWPKVGTWKWAQRSHSHMGMERVSEVLFYAIICALGFEKDIEQFYNLDNVIDKEQSGILKDKLISLKLVRDNGKLISMKWVILKSLLYVLIAYICFKLLINILLY